MQQSRLKDVPGTTIILETKGFDPLAEVKASAAARWVNAVNAEGSHGRWRYELARSVSSVGERSQQSTNNEIGFYTRMVRRALMSDSEMQAELERLRAENAQLKNKDKGGLTLKVSEKGGLSLYGMGRFPVTLYKEQWLRILASAADIEAFIRENDSKLKAKE